MTRKMLTSLSTLKCWPLMGLLSVILIACGTTWLMPVWTTPLHGYDVIGSFVSQDQQSIYIVKKSTSTISIQQTTLAGDQIKEFSFPVQNGTFAHSELVQTGSDAFYLYGTSMYDVAFVEPVSETYHENLETGLAENQYLRLNPVRDSNFKITADEKLAFLGSIVTNVDLRQLSVPIVGLINQNGVLEKAVELPESYEVQALNRDEIGHFHIVLRRQLSEQRTTFLKFDGNLNLLQRSEQDFNFDYSGFVNDRYVGTVFDSRGEGTKWVLTLQGEPLQAIELRNYGSLPQFLAVNSGFFSVWNASDFSHTPVVCFYSSEFNLQWCKKVALANGQNIAVKAAQVFGSDALLVTITAETIRFASTGLQTGGSSGGVNGGIDAQGEIRQELMHFLLNNQGAYIAKTKALPAVSKGNISRCSSGEWCVEAEEASPGFCYYGDTVTIPGSQIYSLFSDCNPMLGSTELKLANWKL